jgi:hypothetical protein
MLSARLLTCFGIVALTSSTALSAQFFIVQDPETKRCTIEERPPASGDSAAVVVGDGAYGDRVSAEADMRAIAACVGNQQQQQIGR